MSSSYRRWPVVIFLVSRDQYKVDFGIGNNVFPVNGKYYRYLFTLTRSEFLTLRLPLPHLNFLKAASSEDAAFLMHACIPKQDELNNRGKKHNLTESSTSQVDFHTYTLMWVKITKE